MGIDDYRFIGMANTVAMEEFSASFYDDTENQTCMGLLEEYKAAGSPKDTRKWLRDRLSSVFVCLMSRPIWVEGSPMWPFCKGQAMTFIAQTSVPECDVSKARLAPNSVLYLFGMRVPVENGWGMRYQVVEQHPSLSSDKK